MGKLGQLMTNVVPRFLRLHMPRALVLASAVISACVSTVSVRVPHPLVRGAVTPNSVPQTDVARAEMFALPDPTFVSVARLITLDAERICFDVSVRVDGARQNVARLDGWRVFLRGDGWENLAPVFGPAYPLTVIPMAGSIPRQQFAGYSQNCMPMGRGMSCSPVPRYIIVREPATIQVLAGRGTVCFNHGGRITPATREVTLHLDDPEDVGYRMAFRWEFMP